MDLLSREILSRYEEPQGSERRGAWGAPVLKTILRQKS